MIPVSDFMIVLSDSISLFRNCLGVKPSNDLKNLVKFVGSLWDGFIV